MGVAQAHGSAEDALDKTSDKFFVPDLDLEFDGVPDAGWRWKRLCWG